MRIFSFVVLVVCLFGAATAADASTSAVGGCQCFGGEQGFAAQAHRWAYGAQRPRARQVYREQRRSVVARRAPYQSQAPRYTYGGRQIVHPPAVQHWTYQAQYPRVVRQAYRGQRRPAVERRAPHQEAEAPRYVHGGGQVAQHQTDRRVSNQEAKTPRYANARGEIIQHPAGCPARLFCGCGASIEAFGRSIRDLWAVASWYRFPRAAPAAGMAVLWGTRHVAIIRQYYGDGTATLYDANSGNGLTRVHRIRIAGLAVVDPHPGQTSPTPNSLMVIL
jgi:hypothetical protein